MPYLGLLSSWVTAIWAPLGLCPTCTPHPEHIKGLQRICGKMKLEVQIFPLYVHKICAMKKLHGFQFICTPNSCFFFLRVLSYLTSRQCFAPCDSSFHWVLAPWHHPGWVSSSLLISVTNVSPFLRIFPVFISCLFTVPPHSPFSLGCCKDSGPPQVPAELWWRKEPSRQV